MVNKLAPLPHEYMLVSIIGFFITIFMVYDWDKTWGVTLTFFFIITFIASIVSISGASTNEEDLVEMAIHNKHVRAGKHRKPIKRK